MYPRRSVGLDVCIQASMLRSKLLLTDAKEQESSQLSGQPNGCPFLCLMTRCVDLSLPAIRDLRFASFPMVQTNPDCLSLLMFSLSKLVRLFANADIPSKPDYFYWLYSP